MSDLIHLEYDLDALKDVLDTEEWVVVVFTAPEWCNPCRQYKPHYEKAAAASGDTWVIYDIHYEADAQVVYNFSGVPTTIVFHNGIEVGRFSGAVNLLPLIAKISDITGERDA